MKRRPTSRMVILYLLFLLPYSLGQLTADAKRLLRDKLTDYDKDMRPVTNLNQTLQLHVGMQIVSIMNFDEVNQKLIVSAILKLVWTDDYMKWNSTEYGGIESLTTKSGHFWTPSMILLNSVYTLKKIGEPWLNIIFNSDGLTQFSPGEVFSATCDADVTYYPVDEHRCTLVFVVWGTRKDEIQLISSSRAMSTSYFTENGGWALTKTKAKIISEENSWETSFVVALHLRRKPRFVVVNIIFPIILVSALNILSFVLPTECGERVTYSITLLLTIAVFLTIIVDGLPNISNPMAIFGYYLLGILFLSSSILLLTLVSIKTFYKDEKELKNIFWNFFVRIFFRERKHCRVTPTDCLEFPEPVDDDKSDECKTQHECGDSESPTVLNMDETAGNITWKEISRMFDKVCFVLISVILALSSIIFFSALSLLA